MAVMTSAPSVPGRFTVHGQDTLPKLFRHVVRERGDKVAMREKDLGIWRAVTWRECGERARHVGLGLVALGLRPQDVVSIIADNCPEWLYTDMGTMCAGGVTNGIYTTDSARQVEYIVNDSGTRFFFAENEEQLDKILEVRARCPKLVKIFVFDMDGLHEFKDEQVMPFAELLALGAEYERTHPGAYEQMAELARPKMMLLDEPSLGLSPKLVKEIFDIIGRINTEQGVTVLLVEQNANMALHIADYGYVLEVGRIVMEDTCARLLEKEDIKEFYLGVKDAGVRGTRRWKRKKTWR